MTLFEQEEGSAENITTRCAYYTGSTKKFKANFKNL